MVVTGGAGFIGSHVCDALLERGDVVTCVDDLVGTGGSTRNVEHLADHPNFELVVEDFLDWSAHADLAGTACVFHQAASKMAVSLRDPERDLMVNAMGTLKLLMRAADAGVGRFVHASTGSVFGESGAPHAIDTPRRPVSLYGVSKLAAESYCEVVGRMFGLGCTVLRYYHVIGPRQDGTDGRGGVVPIFVRKRLEGEPITIFGSGRQTRSFTSVHDVVRANLIVASADEAAGRAYNCASAISVSIAELADFVTREIGEGSAMQHSPARAGDIQNFEIDNSPLRALGVEFDADWRAHVREVVAFERRMRALSQTPVPS
jgi:nucleoside-diphosphate-sugar epimerase